jgi:hypothetical protein
LLFVARITTFEFGGLQLCIPLFLPVKWLIFFDLKNCKQINVKKC